MSTRHVESAALKAVPGECPEPLSSSWPLEGEEHSEEDQSTHTEPEGEELPQDAVPLLFSQSFEQKTDEKVRQDLIQHLDDQELNEILYAQEQEAGLSFSCYHDYENQVFLIYSGLKNRENDKFDLITSAIIRILNEAKLQVKIDYKPGMVGVDKTLLTPELKEILRGFIVFTKKKTQYNITNSDDGKTVPQKVVECLSAWAMEIERSRPAKDLNIPLVRQTPTKGWVYSPHKCLKTILDTLTVKCTEANRKSAKQLVQALLELGKAVARQQTEDIYNHFLSEPISSSHIRKVVLGEDPVKDSRGIVTGRKLRSPPALGKTLYLSSKERKLIAELIGMDFQALLDQGIEGFSNLDASEQHGKFSSFVDKLIKSKTAYHELIRGIQSASGRRKAALESAGLLRRPSRNQAVNFSEVNKLVSHDWQKLVEDIDEQSTFDKLLKDYPHWANCVDFNYLRQLVNSSVDDFELMNIVWKDEEALTKSRNIAIRELREIGLYDPATDTLSDPESLPLGLPPLEKERRERLKPKLIVLKIQHREYHQKRDKIAKMLSDIFDSVGYPQGIQALEKVPQLPFEEWKERDPDKEPDSPIFLFSQVLRKATVLKKAAPAEFQDPSNLDSEDQQVIIPIGQVITDQLESMVKAKLCSEDDLTACVTV